MQVTLAALQDIGAAGAAVAVAFATVLASIIHYRWRREAHARKATVLGPNGTVFAVIDHDGSPELSRWPAPGATGPIPPGGRVVRFPTPIASIGAEVWLAERNGEEIRLLQRAESFDETAALRWGADCVEHAARSLGDFAVSGVAPEIHQAIGKTVASCVSFARSSAAERAYDLIAADQLEHAIARLKTHREMRDVGTAVLSAVTRPGTRWTRFAQPSDERAVGAVPAPWYLLEAGHALLDQDRMKGAGAASSLARQAVVHAVEAAAIHPRSPRSNRPGAAPVSKGGEGAWQMQRLSEYLQRSPAGAQAPASQRAG
jgi:hypothetical protein